VLNAAARVITGTRKFDRGLGQILNDELHWTDVPDRIFFELAVTVHRCLNGRSLFLLEHSSFRIPVLTLGGICDSVFPPTVIYSHVRRAGSTLTRAFFSRWLHDLELFPGLYPGPDDQCRLF